MCQTLSPAAAAAVAAPSPIASMTPTISCPGTMGSVGSGSSPSTTCRSVRQTAQAEMRTRSCPAPGAGTARCSSCSALPGCRNTMARMARLLGGVALGAAQHGHQIGQQKLEEQPDTRRALALRGIKRQQLQRLSDRPAGQYALEL